MALPLATILLDPPTALLVGCGVSLFSLSLIRKRGAVEVTRSAAWGAAWGVVYALAVSWMYFVKTDWMFVYLMDTSRVPLVPTFLGFALTCAAFAAFGALALGHLLEQKRWWAAGLLFAGGVLMMGLLQVLGADQYLRLGTTREYLAGTAKLLQDDPEMLRMMSVSGALAAVPGFGLLGWRFLQGRRA